MSAITVIHNADFADLRDAELAEPWTIYRISNSNNTYTYAISTDGIGFCFYDTLEELEAQH